VHESIQQEEVEIVAVDILHFLALQYSIVFQKYVKTNTFLNFSELLPVLIYFTVNLLYPVTITTSHENKPDKISDCSDRKTKFQCRLFMSFSSTYT
jgi:hypothetical protein